MEYNVVKYYDSLMKFCGVYIEIYYRISMRFLILFRVMQGPDIKN